jgi:arginyl-tRNA synthetase
MGMSTRRGTVKFLDDILADVGDVMHDVMRRNETKYSQVHDPEKVADTLGISAVMIQDMSGKRINNYPFNLERMTSFEGDTGPYLQYAHARLCSISRRTKLSHGELQKADFSLLQEKHAVDLIRLMAQYPDTINHTFKTLEPMTILTYLFRLTHQLSSSYDVLRVVGASEGQEVTIARAALYEAARQVINNGMKLLGLNPVERCMCP